MYFEHVKQYGSENSCDMVGTVQEMAKDFNIPEGEIDYDNDELDTVLSMIEEKVCEQGIEYHCDWTFDYDKEKLIFNVFRILVSSEEELQRYCEIVHKEFVEG